MQQTASFATLYVWIRADSWVNGTISAPVKACGGIAHMPFVKRAEDMRIRQV